MTVFPQVISPLLYLFLSGGFITIILMCCYLAGSIKGGGGESVFFLSFWMPLLCK